ncbi:DegT/DnrJ/EryC1/StrS family aminotransferase, partial [Synechococcus sp. 8F6]|uniref:DegT/DnrJ/EryC1/StrS family aminotransferase n=1 Tax=Synechococcus sp. 8F6 TaxID=2025606 RepID=UPI002100EE3F
FAEKTLVFLVQSTVMPPVPPMSASRLEVRLPDLPSLKQEILKLTRAYAQEAHRAFRPGDDPLRTPYEQGQPIPYAARVFTEDEVEAAVSSTLDFWLTLGSEGAAMEKELASFLGVRHSLLVNSGSSANLVAISALTSHKLPEARRIKPGDEVITVAAGFPTTVAPIVQVGAVPVFIDADPITGNARCEQLEQAYSPGKTKAVMMAHSLGNPFDLATTLAFCRKYNLWLVEDNCDALGCSYSMPRELAESMGFTENSPGLLEGPDRVVRWTGTRG